jgi:hypothetical protein
MDMLLNFTLFTYSCCRYATAVYVTNCSDRVTDSDHSILRSGLHPPPKMKYSGASLIRTPLIRMLHYPDDISGNKLYENLSNVINLSGRFAYPDNFAGNQSVRITRLDCISIIVPFRNSLANIKSSVDVKGDLAFRSNVVPCIHRCNHQFSL